MAVINSKLNLKAGNLKTLEMGEILFKQSDPLEQRPVYYLVAGLIRLQYQLSGGLSFKYYLEPGSIFGIEERIKGVRRQADASSVEKAQVYQWDLESFFHASEDSPKLAIYSIRSLSRLLRVMNSEYSELMTQSARNTRHIKNQKEIKEDSLQLDDDTLSFSQTHLRQIFRDRQILIKEGEILDRIYWLLSGEVFITRKIQKTFKVIAKAGKGELLGEMSFFDKSLTSATVIANGEVQALVFSREDFKELFYANSKWTKQLLSSLSTRIMNMIHQLSQMQ